MLRPIIFIPLFALLVLSCQTEQRYQQTIVPSTFEFLPVGEIKPDGWIRAQLIRDLETGFTGHLDSLTFHASADVFGENKMLGYTTDENGNHHHIPKSWWPGETEPVWLDGFVRAAFLAEHQPSMEKMHNYINYILENQEEDGYIGIYKPEIRYRHTMENAELWAQSRIFRVMLVYYELTGDTRVLEAVIKAVNLTMEKYHQGTSYFSVENALGGVSHGLMIMDILEWLYRFTSDFKYVEYGEFLYKDYSNLDVRRLNDSRLEFLIDPHMELLGHTPHVAEHLRVPVWLHYATGKDVYKTAWENGYEKLERYMVPSGAVHSGTGEDIKGQSPLPTMGYEYCGMTELFDTQKFLLEKTGNTKFADMGEKLVLNAGQGARLSNGEGVNYFSRDNRYMATTEGSGGRYKYSPTHEDVAVCCNPNASKLMPYYVNGMYMKKSDEPAALITTFYGPAAVKTSINGTMTEVRQETGFPFSDTIHFSVEPDKKLTFDLWLRIPEWCNDLTIHIEHAEVSERMGYKIISKKWSPGDHFQIIFDNKIETIKAVNGEIGLQRGPLLYALQMPHSMDVIKEYRWEGFADYAFVPANDAHWYLHFGNDQLEEETGFSVEYDTDYDAMYPWDKSPLYLNGFLMNEEGKEVPVKMAPMGTTILRRLTFPVE